MIPPLNYLTKNLIRYIDYFLLVYFRMVLMTATAYDEFTDDYDRFVNWDSRLGAEMPFLLSKLEEISTPSGSSFSLLDAACGTGMHTIALAKKGFESAGADVSSGMVHRAILNAKEAGIPVLFKTAGFTELGGAFRSTDVFPFDAILCLGNSLPHLTSSGLIRRALQDFHSCLRENGILILQNRNYNAVMARRERWIGPQSHSSAQGEWLFLRFYDFEPDGMITFNIVRLHREKGGEWEQNVSTVHLYPLMRDDLVELLKNSGFHDIQFFGKLEDVAFNPSESENLVVVARKAGE